MRGFLNHDFAAAAVMGDDGGEVRHRPRRNEQRIFLARQLGREAFKFIDGRVIALAESPSFATATAFIIAAVGSVTVSLLKS
jgi:hypothetical protein